MSPLMATAILTEALRRDYGTRPALRDVNLEVREGEMFGILGPNGGGKTTLFRILATLLRPHGGRASIFGRDVVAQARDVRRALGVVFQAPALDRHLTVRENLQIHGRLYGLDSATRRTASAELLERFGIADRANERAGRLSGGLQRRVEIAKGLLHRPRLLLLDEPSTGLDPAMRRDLWALLRGLRDAAGVTVVLTTHFIEEAEGCDRIAILDGGRIVACGPPAELRRDVGGDVIVIRTTDPAPAAAEIERRFGGPVTVVDGTIRLERPGGHLLIPPIVEALQDRIESITLGRPTLVDVFIRRTGRRFEDGSTA